MKIAIFTDTYLPQINGVSHTLSRFTDYLETENHSYMIFAPKFNENDEAEQVQRFFSTPFFLYPECRVSFPNIYRIKEAIKAFQPDVIQLMTEFNMGMIGAKIGKKYQIPTISNYSTNFSKYLKYYHLHIFEDLCWSYLRWFHNQNDLTLCPSNETRKDLIQKGIRNIKIFTRGIDCSHFTPHGFEYNKSKAIELLYVGRVSAEKDLDILLESYQALKVKYGDKLHLTVVGNGPLLENYQTRFGAICTFAGYKTGDELSSYYKQSDIFTFPSSTETLGNVVLEAMASGLPIVGVNAGGVKDNIKHNHNGLLCEPRALDAYKEGIEKLFLNERLRREMGSNGRKEALKKTWSNVFKDLMSIYDSAVYEKHNKQTIA